MFLKVEDESPEQDENIVNNTGCKNIVQKILSYEILCFIVLLFVLSVPIQDFSILQYYLQTTKHAKPYDFALADASAYIAMILGSMVYNISLINMDGTKLIMITQALEFIIFCCNMLYIENVIVMDPVYYMVIMGTASAFIGHLAVMPLVVKASSLTEKGLEATIYSLCLSAMNLGAVLSEEASGLITFAVGVRASGMRTVPIYYLLMVLSQISALYFLDRFPITTPISGNNDENL